MLSNLGSSELIIIFIILVVFFGTKKLNELAHGLGEATKEIKRIKKEVEGGDDE